MRSYSQYLQIVLGVLFGGSSVAMGQDAKSMLKAPAVSAMDHASATPTPSATASEAEKRVIEAEKIALQGAANKLCEQIQVEENDLYHRLSFLEKPSRLDPNSYASLDEINQWRTLLQQFKEKANKVEGLYRGLEKNFDAEVRNSKVTIDPAIVSKFKTVLLGIFPWDTINRKSSLLTQYAEDHQKLLDFYQKNWGTWRPAGKDGKAVFESASLNTTYNKLREDIVSTGHQLEAEYLAMTR
ncbi:MAG: hypothetical protein JO170_07210 [Verrucomicrobia bacterium]|nr:hypothetical protein [Verrucomicrobiota bacterium]